MEKDQKTAGVNPMKGLQACIYKSFFKSLVVTSAVKFIPLKHVFTFKYKGLKPTIMSEIEHDCTCDF